MTKLLTNYWTILSLLLAIRLVFDLIYVKKHKTISTKIKLIATFIPMALLMAYSFYYYGWSGLWVWPLSMVIWWAVFDGIIGLIRHGSVTFMNEKSWPDKVILRYTQNGTLTTITKILLIVFFSGFMWYTDKREKK